MLKYIVSISLFLSQYSYGASADICFAEYSHDGTIYELKISADVENLKLLVDRPTPYGIRNYSYEITEIDCQNHDAITVYTHNHNSELLDLVIRPINGSTSCKGTIYFNKKYRDYITWTCVPEVLHVLCGVPLLR
ncbi:MAG: hypothetical protein ACKOX6_17920 [Bdellovibrio sp.]